MATSYLEIDNLSVIFKTRGAPFVAVRDIDVKVEKGEFVSIIGHSGCGKSTVLNVVAGLTPAAQGGAVLAGREIDGPSPERAVVFQNHSLLPWLTCYGNVHLAVERVDEPFGALDALTRANLQDSLMEIQARLSNTVLMITHDVDEAVLLSDRVVMMTNGPAATVGSILSIDLPRPRRRIELADDPHYNHLRAEILRFLHERQGHPVSVAA